MQIRKIGWGFGLCNMRCQHCYNESGMNDRIPQYSFNQLKKVADKICPYIRDINFGTGELLCNPNALELVRYIAFSYGHVDMALTTNGFTVTQMNPVEVKRLFNDVDISIDFPDRDRHNAFRVHSEAWEWAMQALALMQEIRKQHTIVMCITSLTTDQDILGMLELATESGSCLRFNWFRQVGRGPQSLRISARRAWEVIDLVADHVVFSALDSVFAAPLGVESKPCPAGHLSARIHEDMSVTAYPFVRGPGWNAGNIMESETSLNAIYESPVFRRLRERRVPDCADCEFLSECRSGCVTRAALHNGGVSKPDDYCAKYYGAMDIAKRLKGRITVQKQGNLVHDGYLCTTTMRPRGC